jgi:hypothetical protein
VGVGLGVSVGLGAGVGVLDLVATGPDESFGGGGLTAAAMTSRAVRIPGITTIRRAAMRPEVQRAGRDEKVTQALDFFAGWGSVCWSDRGLMTKFAASRAFRL